ncbi:MAG TPA: hypothetical protein VFA04_01330, partial [Bryobacteraceae bacterium]|nr:hypothetical protein [Bryobacteraceae bacterium]
QRITVQKNDIRSPGWGGVVAYGDDSGFDIGFNRVTGSVDSQRLTIAAVTNSSPCTLRFTSAHRLRSGDQIVIYGGRGAWQRIDYTPAHPNFTVNVVSPTEVTIPFDSSSLGPLGDQLNAIPAAATTRYWAGSYDAPSNEAVKRAPDVNGQIHDNYASGMHMYGAVYRLGSGRGLIISNNVAENIEAGSIPTSMLAISPRCAGMDCSDRGLSDIRILGNHFVASGRYLNCINIQNKVPDNSANLPAAYGISIENNQCVSPGPQSCFANGIMVNGQDGGIRNVTVRGNTVEGDDTKPWAVVRGVVTVIAGTSAAASSAIVSNNVSTCGGIPNPRSVGIQLGPHSRDIAVDSNAVAQHGTAIMVDPQSERPVVGRNNRFQNTQRAVTR